MKRIMIWGLFLFTLLAMNVEAKDQYLVKVDIINNNEPIKTNIAFLPEDFNAFGYDVFENGFYLLNKADSEVFSTESNYVFEMPEGLKKNNYQMIVVNDDGRFKTDSFKCHYVKDENEDYVCYLRYDYIGGILNNTTNVNVLVNSIARFKESILATVIISIILVVLAIMYDNIMKKRGANNLINVDIFFIIFNLAVIVLGFVLYIVNIFNSYSSLVLMSVVLAIYYFVYYLLKAVSAKEAGGVRYLSAVFGYLIALLSSILVFSYFI